MDYYLYRSVPPVTEPVSLQDALTQCHANLGSEDSWFLDKIKAGRERVEDYTRRSLLRQTWVLRYDSNTPAQILLPRSPVMEVTNARVQGVEIEDVELITEGIPARLLLPITLAGKSSRIEYMAGYGDLPEDVPQVFRDAILLYISWSWENRAGEGNIPKAFYDLLEPYRLHL